MDDWPLAISALALLIALKLDFFLSVPLCLFTASCEWLSVSCVSSGWQTLNNFCMGTAFRFGLVASRAALPINQLCFPGRSQFEGLHLKPTAWSRSQAPPTGCWMTWRLHGITGWGSRPKKLQVKSLTFIERSLSWKQADTGCWRRMFCTDGPAMASSKSLDLRSVTNWSNLSSAIKSANRNTLISWNPTKSWCSHFQILKNIARDQQLFSRSWVQINHHQYLSFNWS